MPDTTDPREVTIDYTNYRGERSLRRILPLGIFWGANEWHPEEQWLLSAVDLEKNAARILAMRDIHSWKAVTPKRQMTYWGKPLAELSDDEIRIALMQVPDGVSPESCDFRLALEMENEKRSLQPSSAT